MSKTMSANEKIERKIIRKMISELAKVGYTPKAVWDGEEYVDAETTEQALDAIFAVDESTLHFQAADGHWGNLGVFLVGGNGNDVISDYHYHTKDRPHAAFTACVDMVSAMTDEID